ncbi:MAG: ATP-binding cassette domain-containing protein [Acidimicrobiales bacterium]
MQLEIDDVHVAYGRTEVLFGVSLTVADGSLTCLMGRNGVGKSTLLNAVSGLLGIRKGTVRLDGRDITRLSAPQRALAGIGYVPQGHQVFPHLSAMENLLVVAERRRRSDRSAIDGRSTCSRRCASCSTGRPGCCRVGRRSSWPSPGRWCRGPSCSSSTNPPRASSRRSSSRSRTPSPRCTPPAACRSCWSSSTWSYALRLAQTCAVMDRGVITQSGSTEAVEESAFAELLAV